MNKEQMKEGRGAAVRRRRLIIMLGGAAGLFLIAAGLWLATGRKPAAKVSEGQKPATVAARAAAQGGVTSAPVQQVQTTAKPTLQPKGMSGTGAVASAASLTADQRRVEQMRKQLDLGDELNVLKIARTLLASPDPDVRSQVVEALGWLGVVALPELTTLMNDPDADVAEDAYEQWKLALMDVEDPLQKAAMLSAKLATETRGDRIDELMMEYNSLPEDVALRHLAELIKADRPVVSDAANELFEDKTGERYTEEALEKYIRENAEEPEQEPAAKK